MNIVDPEIIRQSIELPRATYEIAVPEQLYYLQGHFPGKPILAGCCAAALGDPAGENCFHIVEQLQGN